jgi:hypothetical protein
VPRDAGVVPHDAGRAGRGGARALTPRGRPAERGSWRRAPGGAWYNRTCHGHFHGSRRARDRPCRTGARGPGAEGRR